MFIMIVHIHLVFRTLNFGVLNSVIKLVQLFLSYTTLIHSYIHTVTHSRLQSLPPLPSPHPKPTPPLSLPPLHHPYIHLPHLPFTSLQLLLLLRNTPHTKLHPHYMKPHPLPLKHRPLLHLIHVQCLRSLDLRLA